MHQKTMFDSVDDSNNQADHSNPKLIQSILEAIAQSPNQRISFATFMEQALYHENYGYYASNASQLGPWGDFVTSAHISKDFGELLAIQFKDLWIALDRPPVFTLVEMGAGQGLISTDVIRFIQKSRKKASEWERFSHAVEVVIIEKAPALVKAQKAYLQKLPPLDIPIQWKDLSDLGVGEICGCFFSNELLDAFPVHRVTLCNGKMQEIFVGPSQDSKLPFEDVVAKPSTPDLAAYFQSQDISFSGPTFPEGYATEVNLELQDWVIQVAQSLGQGFVLTIDYGYLGPRYYHPSRTEGTLQCFYKHRFHTNPYLNIGNQDITAHVNFSALQQYGEAHQLQTLGFTQQGLFLMALGLGDRLLTNMHESSGRSLQEILHRREGLHALMNPMGLGGFKVLLQGKGLAQNQYPFRGFQEGASTYA